MTRWAKNHFPTRIDLHKGPDSLFVLKGEANHESARSGPCDCRTLRVPPRRVDGRASNPVPRMPDGNGQRAPGMRPRRIVAAVRLRLAPAGPGVRVGVERLVAGRARRQGGADGRGPARKDAQDTVKYVRVVNFVPLIGPAERTLRTLSNMSESSTSPAERGARRLDRMAARPGVRRLEDYRRPG